MKRHRSDSMNDEIVFDKKMLQNILMSGISVDKLVRNHSLTRKVDSIETPTQVTPTLSIKDQKKSGRCWIFASLHPASLAFSRKYNLGKKFYFSPSYLYYYHMLENSFIRLKKFRINRHLNIWDEPLDSLTSSPVYDGGYINSAENLIRKYGLVPIDQYKDLSHNKNTKEVKSVLKSAMRYYMMLIKNAETDESAKDAEDLGKQKVTELLNLFLGEPPKKITIKLNEKEITLTPLDLYNKYVRCLYNYANCAYITHDPRHYFKIKTAQHHLNSNLSGRRLHYINLPSDKLLHYIKVCIDRNISVPFIADIDKYRHPEGLLDTEAYRYDFLGLKQLNKHDRMDYNHSYANHAMTFVGYGNGHLKVANSWGEYCYQEGYFTMSENWFHEYVYAVAVPDKMLDQSDKHLQRNSVVKFTYHHSDLF